MSENIRPAVEVWDDAIAAWAADTIDTRQAAAAVIQAYGDEREAKGREEQAAELAKFKALAETLAGALEQIEKAPAWGYPDKWETTPAQVRILAREALTSYKEQRDAS